MFPPQFVIKVFEYGTVGVDTGLLKAPDKARVPSSDGDKVWRFGEYSFYLFQGSVERRKTDDAHTESGNCNL